MIKKSIYITFCLIFFLNCRSSRNAIAIKGVYEHKNGRSNLSNDECEINFYETHMFKFTCIYNHLGTTVEGRWKMIDKDKIIIEVVNEDTFPMYPDKFYKKIDTLYILNDTSIICNNKIFLLNKSIKF